MDKEIAFWVLSLWGAAGAFIYAANAFVFKAWNEGVSGPARIRAALEFFIAVSTGAIAAGGLTRPILGVLDAGVNLNGVQVRLDPDAVAVALTVGWVSNYLWPKLLKRLGDRVEKIGSGETV